MSQRWYVIVTEPQMEGMVANRLARPDPFSGRPAFEVLWPHFLVSKIRFGAIVTDPEPMFPGYLFFRSDCRPAAPGHWKLIGHMFGVAGLLPRHLEYPVAVPDALIELLKRCTIGGMAKLSLEQFINALNRYFDDGTLDLEVPTDDPFCQVGFMVPVVAGPFGGRRGECIKADAQTAVLKIWCFGRDVEVTVLQAHLGSDKWEKTQHVDRPKRKAYIRRQEQRVAPS